MYSKKQIKSLIKYLREDCGAYKDDLIFLYEAYKAYCKDSEQPTLFSFLINKDNLIRFNVATPNPIMFHYMYQYITFKELMQFLSIKYEDIPLYINEIRNDTIKYVINWRLKEGI